MRHRFGVVCLLCIGGVLGLGFAGFAAPVAGDVDSSGGVDAVDVQLVVNGVLGMSASVPTDVDYDANRATDAVDVQLTVNAVLGVNIDADADGLCDAAESNLGTNANNPDTDGDGTGDGDEVLVGRDPLVPDAVIAIDDIEELQKIGLDEAYPLDGAYELAGNIDASATATWKAGEGFAPIGTQLAPFTGTFDGQSFTISGLVINRPTEDYVGLFGYAGVFDTPTQSATIARVNVSGGSIVGKDYVGALCGYAGNGTISDCHTSTAVMGNRSVGGVAGFSAVSMLDSSAVGAVTSLLNASNETDGIGGIVGSNGGSIQRCTGEGTVSGLIGVGGLAGANDGTIREGVATGDVNSTSAYVGGLVGINLGPGTPGSGSGGLIEDCRSGGTVTGGFEVGGLVGRNDAASSVLRCRASGNVEAMLFGGAGGLIGFNRDSSVAESFAEGVVAISSSASGAGGLIGINAIFSTTAPVSDCYALGPVSASDRVGGLVGDATASGPIVRCYSAGAVTSPSSDAGGLVGIVNPGMTPVSDSFWDTQTSGKATSAGGGTGLTTAQMKSQANFTTAGWDFVETWSIDEGASYPFLLWTVSPK